MNKTYYVYVHTLKTDGRKYFGLTCQSLKERWRDGQGYKGCCHFYNAIQKYGWDAFYHHIVLQTNNREEAYNTEEHLIEDYKTTNEKYGFNIRTGGLTPELSKESIQKIVAKRKGKKMTGQALENIRIAAKNRDNSVFAHPRSEETKRKISESHKGMTYGEETKQKLRDAFSIPVVCIELNKVFSSMTEAAKYFNANKTSISAAIKGRTKTALGYHWKLF